MLGAGICIGFFEYWIPFEIYTGAIKYSGSFNLISDGSFLLLIMLLVSFIGCAIFNNLTP